MAKRKYFMNTRVAGFMYHEAVFCYDELKVGRELTMRREMDNRYDPRAVALYCGDFHIGYLSKDENEQISVLLEQGWDDLFEVRINSVDDDTHPERRIDITIFVKAKAEFSSTAICGGV